MVVVVELPVGVVIEITAASEAVEDLPALEPADELAAATEMGGAVPLALRLSPRLDSPYVFAGPKRGPFDFHNSRRRAWGPAVEAAGVTKPARLYDLRSTFISNALASGLTIFEVARITGTSTAMVESRYGALLDSARESLLERLEAVR